MFRSVSFWYYSYIGQKGVFMNVLNSNESFVIISSTTGRVLGENCQLIQTDFLVGKSDFVNINDLPQTTKVFDNENAANLVLNVLKDSYDDAFSVYRLVSIAQNDLLIA